VRDAGQENGFPMVVVDDDKAAWLSKVIFSASDSLDRMRGKVSLNTRKVTVIRSDIYIVSGRVVCDVTVYPAPLIVTLRTTWTAALMRICVYGMLLRALRGTTAGGLSMISTCIPFLN
jgi:hypothetical protein